MATISLTGSGVAYTQDFNGLATTGTANNLNSDPQPLPGWFVNETGAGARDNELYGADTGGSNTADTYSYGSAPGGVPSGERALGQLRSGTLISTIGAQFTNDTGGTISSLQFAYTGEQWRFGGAHATVGDKLNFQISFDATSLTTGTWVDVDALDFNTPITAGTVGALDGNLAANRTSLAHTLGGLTVNAGQTFWIRFNDVDASGSDDGLAIDDFSITPTVSAAVSPGQLSIADATVTEGAAGTTTPISFTVTRANGDDGAVGATWTVTFGGGANDAGADDFEPGETFTGTVDFADGETSKTIVLDVQGDASIEPNETFTVTLSTPTVGATLSDAVATGTINNDDTPSTPAATVADAAIAEGASGVTYLTFTVTLSFAPTGPVTIDYATSNGTATAGSDYLAVSGQLAFAAGETSKTISVPIVGDATSEATETFNLTLSNASGATIGDGAALGTITNDDGPGYFSLASGNFSEDWTNTGRITTNDNWSGVPFIVGYLGDYTSESPTGVDARTLTAANTLGNVDVIANQMTTGSTSGGVGEFEIANPTIGLQGSGTADAPSIVLYMDASGRTDVRVQALLRDIDASTDDAAQQINVQYRTSPNGAWTNAPGGYFSDVTTTGSATQTTVLDILLPAAANNAAQLEIRIMTTNAAGSDEWVGIDDIVVSSAQSAPSYSVADAAAFEGTGGGNTPLVFTVTRAGDSSAAGTVDYAVTFAGGGFSADAADFASALAGQVSFLAGETSKTITLDIVQDANPEADEGFTVTLSNPSAGTIGDGTGIGTIVNDDGSPPLLTIADVVQSEGDNGATIFTFTVTRTGGSGPITVDYATDGTGTATAGDDYVPTSGTLTFAEGDNSETFSVTVNGDTAGEPAETFGVTLSNPTGFAVIADPTATGTIQNDDLIFIHDVQGSSYYSPILAAEGKTGFNVASATVVRIQAVVTAVDNDGPRQGFYITEETVQWDGSKLTSEGIFVMTRNDANSGSEVGVAAPGLQVGDLVTVSALVMEYQAFQSMPRTMLVNPSSITINSSGNVLPKLLLDAGNPIPNSILTLVKPDYSDSADDAGDTFDASLYALSFWETVEGMLVTIPDMVVADGFVSSSGGQPIFQAYSTVHADADQINSRGGYTIAGDPPLSPPDTLDPEDNTIAGGRHIHDGDINPDIIEIDFSGFAIDAPAGLATQATIGDKLGAVTGIVDFDFTDRKLFVTEYDPAGFVNNVPVRETTALGSDARALTVATFNVENLDPGDGQARFNAIAQAIATNLNAPDILIIEEIQDNNGATASGGSDASVTWQTLVDALNLATGKTYQWVDEAPVPGAEGGEPGGNIRVGFLYDTGRVQLGNLAPDASLADRRKFTDRVGDGVRDAGDLIAYSDDMVAGEINTGDWTSTRKSLLAQFSFNGNDVFLVGNHFTAKGGSGDIWQIDQDILAGEPANAGWSKRVEQAEDVYHVLNLIQTSAASARVVAGGDFNDFYFYRPLEVVTGHVETDGTARSGGTRFDNLTLLLSEAERFTYTFDGRSQALDHIVTSQALSAVATYDVVHINTGYNQNGTGADADPSLSDHDPAVASFDFRSLAETLRGTAGNDTLEGFGGNDRLEGGEGDDRLDGGAGADTMVGGNGDDVYIVDDAGDVVVEDPNGGTDEVRTALGSRTDYTALYVLPANVEKLTGTSADAQGVTGNALDNVIVMGAGGDLVVLSDGGNDNVQGNGGDDFFYYAGAFTSADSNDGGAGIDTVALMGVYDVDLSATSLVNVEKLALYSSGNAQAPNSYNVKTDDANVAAGESLMVIGMSLQANETLAFDGSAETDGRFNIRGGRGADDLTGGAQSDQLYGNLGADLLSGGGGNDFFEYYAAAESTAASRDTIRDFATGDRINLINIDADGNAANGDNAFNYIGSAAFTGSAGQLRVTQGANEWLVEADIDGDTVADLVIGVNVVDGHMMTQSDFFI